MATSSTKRGALILFEGVDRCGKTTQALRLVDNLKKIGQNAVLMRFPDRETAIGSIINKYLTKEIELDDRSVHLLFSANRWEKSVQLMELLNNGTHIVMDRYAYSGVAFSAAKNIPSMDLAWCKQPDTGLPMPDVIFFMDIPLEKAALRGGFGGERYEKPEFQKIVREQFQSLENECSTLDKTIWTLIDAGDTIENIAEGLLNRSKEVIERSSTRPIRKLWNGSL